MTTPVKGEPFAVESMDQRGVLVLLGEKETLQHPLLWGVPGRRHPFRG